MEAHYREAQGSFRRKNVQTAMRRLLEEWRRYFLYLLFVRVSELKPFGIMPEIMAISDEIVLLHASCNDCNRDASYTYYNGSKDSDILVGNDNYIALCPKCLRKRLTLNK